jgi:hypothetical protein
MKKIKFFILNVSSISLLLAANVDIPLNSPIYNEVERLQALGVITTLTTASKPYNTKELINAISQINDPNFYIEKIELLNEIKRYTNKNIIDTTLTEYYSYQNQSLKNPSGRNNNEGTVFFTYKNGLRLKKGLNIKLQTRFQYLINNFSIVFTPAYTNSLNKKGLDIKDTYLRYSWTNINFTFGREALWMGPSHSGTLLFSNNAKPIDMIRISNIKSFKLNFLPTTVSNIIGYINANVFLGRLSKYKHIKLENDSINEGYPKILGMQFSFKPTNNFEWGIYRTAIFGGGGRQQNLSTFRKVMWPSGDAENKSTTEPGDQKGGFFAIYNFFNKIQPLKIYTEYAGEDAAGMLPSKWSSIFGIKLFDVAKIKGLSLNYEYTKMDKSNVWYTHHIYLDGYTNNGIIMGHAHGGIGFVHYLNITYQPSLKQTLSLNLAKDNFRNFGKTNNITICIRKKYNKNIEFSLETGFNNSSKYKNNYFVNISGKLLKW